MMRSSIKIICSFSKTRKCARKMFIVFVMSSDLNNTSNRAVSRDLGSAGPLTTKLQATPNWNTIHQWNFCQIWMSSPPCTNVRPPYSRLSGDRSACNHFHADGLHLSRAQPCSSVSSLSHSTFLLDVQSSTDKTLTTTQDRLTLLQNSDEKEYCHLYCVGNILSCCYCTDRD